MKKQLLASILASNMILGTLSPVIAAIETKEESPLIAVEQHTLSTNEADFTFENGVITKYNGNDPVVNIPSTIGGEPVTAINSSAFKNNTSLLTVTIPEGVTEVGYDAFYGCSSLLSVTIPSTLMSVGAGAFRFCSKLTSVTLPESVQSIGNYAFDGCSTLSNINFPSSLVSIGNYAFNDCYRLAKADFPSGLMSIGDHAFADCDTLSSLDIPASVQSIGSYAFRYCDALTEVALHEGLLSIGNYAFYDCSLLTIINLPESLLSLGSNVFSGCKGLKSFEFPSGFTVIPESTFAGCSNLSFVSLPNSITTIGSKAFYSCASLDFLYLPNTVTSIGSEVFRALRGYNVYYTLDISLQTVSGSYAESYAIENEFTYLTVPEGFVPSEYTDSNDRVFQTLPTATMYSSYLTKILDVTDSTTLSSGSLPSGLGVYPDGTIGGVPTETGTFEFVVNTTMGEMPYTITIQENTSSNVEVDNDFNIIERIPTVSSNEQDYVYEVSGEYSQLLNVYLNGSLLIPKVDFLSEEGSTKITILSNTMAQLNSGSHTINATFTPVSVTPSTSSSANVTVEKVAQTFNKTTPATTEPAIPFSDVNSGDWYYDSVLFVYKKGTFSGITPDSYAPDTGMSRGMMATVLYALAGKPATENTNLSDLNAGDWYYDAVNWVVSRGIDSSVEKFRPDELITREETAVMLSNFCTAQGIWLPLVASSSPSDFDSVSESAKIHVDALFQQGIFAGDEYGNFNPMNNCSRAEVSTIMRNFMQIVL